MKFDHGAFQVSNKYKISRQGLFIKYEILI